MIGSEEDNIQEKNRHIRRSSEMEDINLHM